MTDAERKIVATHLACDRCGRIANREEHRRLMLAMKQPDKIAAFRVWLGWEIDTRAGRNRLLCPECAE